MSRGFFTIAQGPKYQRLAYALALSLKLTQPKGLNDLSIGVTTEELSTVPSRYRAVFDQVVEIPWGDHAKNSTWKLENEWKVVHMTPYRETIKLDADMLFPASISSWWKPLSAVDGVFCTAPITYRGEKITSDFYRKTFTESALPNIYTALYYFKNTASTFDLFKLAEQIFNNWQRYFYEFLEAETRPAYPSTDIVFALASKLLDYEQLAAGRSFDFFTFVHMKTRLQGWPKEIVDEDWTKALTSSVRPNADIALGAFKQTTPVHYHVKNFVTDAHIASMERELGV